MSSLNVKCDGCFYVTDIVVAVVVAILNIYIYILFTMCVYAKHCGAIDNDLSSLWLTEKKSNSMQIGNCICMKLNVFVCA